MNTITSEKTEAVKYPPGAFMACWYPGYSVRDDMSSPEPEPQTQPTRVSLFDADGLATARQYSQSLDEDGRHRLQSILSQLDKAGRFKQ